MNYRPFVFVTILFGLSACSGNFFSGLDTPSGDEQSLSKARACFDQGDFSCAQEYYEKVSSQKDAVNSELAFKTLAENSMGVETFMHAIVDYPTDIGKLLTLISGDLSRSAGLTRRLALLSAFKQGNDIANDQLRGLVHFVTAVSFAAEILSEAATTPGKLYQTDLVSNPTLCVSSLGMSGCGAPSSSNPLYAPGSAIASLKLATVAQITNTPTNRPTLYMLNAAITDIQAALLDMAASGDLASSFSEFSNALSAIALAALPDAPTYRFLLISAGIGL